MKQHRLNNQYVYLKTKMDSNNDLRRHDLTIEEIRACPLFAHLSDGQAQEVINSIKQFTRIAFDAFQREKKVNNLKRSISKKQIP
jgi:hypothetical protein